MTRAVLLDARVIVGGLFGEGETFRVRGTVEALDAMVDYLHGMGHPDARWEAEDIWTERGRAQVREAFAQR